MSNNPVVPGGPFFTPGAYGQQPGMVPMHPPVPANVHPQPVQFQSQPLPPNFGPTPYTMGQPAPPPMLQPPMPGQQVPPQLDPQYQQNPPQLQTPMPPQQMPPQMPPHQHPESVHAANLAHGELMALLQQAQQQIQQLNLRINGIQGRMSGPDLNVKFPPQNKAGIIEYPDLLPYPFCYGIFELTEGGNQPFATTATESRVTISLDTIYTYFTNVDLGLICTAAPQGSEQALFTWLPRSAHNTPYSPAGATNQSFSFLFNVKSKSNGIPWSSGFMPSSILDMQLGQGWRLPVEFFSKEKDDLIIEAIPLIAAPDGFQYRLYAFPWGYQMRSRRG